MTEMMAEHLAASHLQSSATKSNGPVNDIPQHSPLPTDTTMEKASVEGNNTVADVHEKPDANSEKSTENLETVSVTPPKKALAKSAEQSSPLPIMTVRPDMDEYFATLLSANTKNQGTAFDLRRDFMSDELVVLRAFTGRFYRDLIQPNVKETSVLDADWTTYLREMRAAIFSEWEQLVHSDAFNAFELEYIRMHLPRNVAMLLSCPLSSEECEAFSDPVRWPHFQRIFWTSKKLWRFLCVALSYWYSVSDRERSHANRKIQAISPYDIEQFHGVVDYGQQTNSIETSSQQIFLDKRKDQIRTYYDLLHLKKGWDSLCLENCGLQLGQPLAFSDGQWVRFKEFQILEFKFISSLLYFEENVAFLKEKSLKFLPHTAAGALPTSLPVAFDTRYLARRDREMYVRKKPQPLEKKERKSKADKAENGEKKKKEKKATKKENGEQGGDASKKESKKSKMSEATDKATKSKKTSKEKLANGSKSGGDSAETKQSFIVTLPLPTVKRVYVDPPFFELVQSKFPEEVFWKKMQIREFFFRFDKIFKLPVRYYNIMNDPTVEWNMLYYKSAILILMKAIAKESPAESAYRLSIEFDRTRSDDAGLWPIVREFIRAHGVDISDGAEDDDSDTVENVELARAELMLELITLVLETENMRTIITDAFEISRQMQIDAAEDLKQLKANWIAQSQQISGLRSKYTRKTMHEWREVHDNAHNAYLARIDRVETRLRLHTIKNNSRTEALGVDYLGNVYWNFQRRTREACYWGSWMVVEMGAGLQHPSGEDIKDDEASKQRKERIENSSPRKRQRLTELDSPDGSPDVSMNGFKTMEVDEEEESETNVKAEGDKPNTPNGHGFAPANGFVAANGGFTTANDAAIGRDTPMDEDEEEEAEDKVSTAKAFEGVNSIKNIYRVTGKEELEQLYLWIENQAVSKKSCREQQEKLLSALRDVADFAPDD